MSHRGKSEREMIDAASGIVDIGHEFWRRMTLMRAHVSDLWKVIREIEAVVQDSKTLDPFTKSTLLRLCAGRSARGIVETRGGKDFELSIPDGGPAGEPKE